jgi:hypothetical protein
MAEQKPNILFIMGDDIGWYNISAYNLGVMGYRTPNIDRIEFQGIPASSEAGQLQSGSGDGKDDRSQSTLSLRSQDATVLTTALKPVVRRFKTPSCSAGFSKICNGMRQVARSNRFCKVYIVTCR